MLFDELTDFTNTYHLLFGKSRETSDHSFQPHSFELLEIDVANSFVPKFHVGFDFEAFCKRNQLHLVRFEDEHSAFST